MKYKTTPKITDPLSVVGFGCWAAGGSDIWNGTNDADSIRAIHHALDLGINLFDVAPVYGLGHAEEILGRALHGRRDKAFIASKCGLVWDDQNRVTNNLTAAGLQTEIEESLRRLQTDVIDLLQIHWPDPNTPIAETMSALERIKQSGKIRYIGVSNFSLALTKEALAHGDMVSFQGLYNLLERNPRSYHGIPLDYRVADEILPFCADQGLAFLPYSPILQGLLTDGFKAEGNFDDRDARAANPKLNGELFARYYAISRELRELARAWGRPLAQLAINWLIAQPAVTSVIAGAQTVAHIAENGAAADWTLTPAMLSEIDAVLAPHVDFLQAA
jgi:aryl-alcohol dehydrogenase-like predicted oxidoreductase